MKNLKLWRRIISSTLFIAVIFTTVLGNDLIYKLTQVFYPIYANGYQVSQDSLPILNYNGSTYVPLRKLSEAAGVNVTWNNAEKSVYINNNYIDTTYLYRIITTEHKAEEWFSSISSSSYDLLLVLERIHNGEITKETSLSGLPAVYSLVSRAQNDFQSVFSYSFPGGLNTNQEYEKTLLEYIDCVNSAMKFYDQAYNYVLGYAEGIYAYEYVYKQLDDLRWQIAQLSPIYLSLSQESYLYELLQTYY